MALINIIGKLTPEVLQPYKARLEYFMCADGFEMPITIVGKGKPVLMLHAFGMDARQFLPFILPLTKQFCFYLPHLRGFGLASRTPTTDFNFIEQYANDVDQLLSYICLQHNTDAIDVAAISMGALVMWAYFNRQHSESLNSFKLDLSNQATNIKRNKVKRYLNIDQSPIVHNQPDWQGGVFGEKQDAVFAQFKEVMEATLPYFSEDSLFPFTHLPYSVKRKITDVERAFSLISVNRKHSNWLINITNRHPAHRLAFYNHSTWQQKLRGMRAYIELPYDYRVVLPHLETPVTMLIGGHSKLYEPKWQYKIAQLLPNAQTIEIAKSGHAVPMDAPIAFTRSLKYFLKD